MSAEVADSDVPCKIQVCAIVAFTIGTYKSVSDASNQPQFPLLRKHSIEICLMYLLQGYTNLLGYLNP